ncbi:BMP family protein [Naasia sp. SYSU D00057]|uniref:BMP family lipoprotein n=1 Tax=Naasia sp. SYSU D00057 TaxID=2817380 RepID=UPI001B30802F|nr:BMP family ABC transporter substrate-binding protein [Naasia sp. SYSU D00057]
MRRSTTARSLAGLAIAATVIAISACASAPEETEGGGAAAGGDYIPCAVSDLTGFKDKSFNELTFAGLTEAADELGLEPKSAESNSEDQYAGNIDGMVDQGCNLIVTVGFALATATRDAAANNPDVDFALIDSTLTDDDFNPIEADNVKPVLFDTAQAAFLAGYAAAGASKTGVVGTYGGMPFPSVTIFMDGFVDGVAHYNSVHDTEVRVIGWDKAKQDGLFVGSFDDQGQAKVLSEGLLDQGVDVLMPVAGTLFKASAEAVKERGLDGAIIGVNDDAYVSAPEYKAFYLTSVLKNLTSATKEVTMAAANGEFDNEPYVGTLENDGVGIAPLHDWESKVAPELVEELEALTADIVAGEITVDSPSAPQQ